MKMPVRTYLIFTVITALVSLSCPGLYGQDSPDTFMSFGMKEINPANKAQSRNEALSECLMDAVRQYTSRNVPVKMFEANDALLRKKIYDNFNLFLLNYRIKEEKEEDNFYKMTAEVSLNAELLLDKLRALGLTKEATEKPTLAMLISDIETVNRVPRESSWWTRDMQPSTYAIPDRIERRLGSLGFKLMNKARFISKLEDSKVSLKNRLLKGDIETIRTLGLDGVLILGSSNLSVSKDGKETKENSLTLNVSVFDLSDGAKLADFERIYDLSSGPSAGSEEKESINSIMDKFSTDLVESFLPKWHQRSNTNDIDLVVQGIDSYASYRDIKKLLLGIKPSVISVKDAAMEKGLFKWRIKINDKTSVLAKRIALEKIDGRRIRVTKVSPKNITIDLK